MIFALFALFAVRCVSFFRQISGLGKPCPCILAALTVLLAACTPLPPAPPPTQAVISPQPTVSLPSTPSPSPGPNGTPTEISRPGVTRVVIISIDGLRPDAIDLAPMPVLQELIRTGAYSLAAQTVMPSTTLPAHTSMISGLCPAAHSITWDEYLPEKGYALGTDLFDIVHAAGLRTVMVVGKEKLRQMVEPASLDTFLWVNDPDPVVAQRAADLIPRGFSLLFIHLPDADAMGHAYGWMSNPQLLALRGTDAALKTILEALDAASMRQATLIIVSSDHGGHATSHGFDIPADMTIPWIANGPGVVPAVLTSRIHTTDTAATAAWALGLPLPPEWSGRPVLEAFGGWDAASRPEPRCPQ